MAHNRTPMADVEDDDTFWNGTPGAARRPAAAVRRARLPDGHLRAAGAVRRRDARAVHRRGRAAARRPSPARVARSTAFSRRPPRGSRAPRRASGSRGELRIAASSRRVGDESVERGVVGQAEPAQASGAGRRRAAACRWRRSRRPPRSPPTPRPTPRRARCRRARARDRASRGRSAGPPGRTAASAVPWATLPRVPIEWPSAWTSPTPVPLAWPTPARCEASSICERASRSEPSATARRSHVPTVRMTPSAIASANGFGLADRSDSSEWVIASIPVAAVTAGGRPTVRPGSRMVVTGSSDGMADVVLAPDLLVGDDREAVRLGAGAGRRRDRDDRAGRASGPGRRTRAPRPAGRWPPARSMRLGRVHRRSAADRHDDRARQPERRAGAAAPRSTVAAAGFGSTSSKTAGREAGRRERVDDRIDDPGPPDARIGHDEGARAAGRGDHLGESLDRPDPEQDPVAQDHLELAVGQARHRDDLERPCRSRCRAGPSASAGSRPSGTSARSSARRGSRRPRPRRSRARRGR